MANQNDLRTLLASNSERSELVAQEEARLLAETEARLAWLDSNPDLDPDARRQWSVGATVLREQNRDRLELLRKKLQTVAAILEQVSESELSTEIANQLVSQLEGAALSMRIATNIAELSRRVLPPAETSGEGD